MAIVRVLAGTCSIHHQGTTYAVDEGSHLVDLPDHVADHDHVRWLIEDRAPLDVVSRTLDVTSAPAQAGLDRKSVV